MVVRWGGTADSHGGQGCCRPKTRTQPWLGGGMDMELLSDADVNTQFHQHPAILTMYKLYNSSLIPSPDYASICSTVHASSGSELEVLKMYDRNVIFNENRSGRLFIKSFLKTSLKSLCYVFFQNLLHLFIRVNYKNYIYLKISCHVFQHGIIAQGLSTHKFSHLTKPTSKLPLPNAMGQKRSKNKCQ
ncbi:hypothetical protein LXL04_030485 [Taraxacum kok-saghyz]